MYPSDIRCDAFASCALSNSPLDRRRHDPHTEASADKIKNEIAKFGNPPQFPVIDEAAAAAAAAEKAAEKAADAKNADPTKFVAKKSKAQAKVTPNPKP